jgi:hypothetical protein
MFCVYILGIASVLLGIIGSSAVAVMSIGATWMVVAFLGWNIIAAAGFISYLALHPATRLRIKESRATAARR